MRNVNMSSACKCVCKSSGRKGPAKRVPNCEKKNKKNSENIEIQNRENDLKSGIETDLAEEKRKLIEEMRKQFSGYNQINIAEEDQAKTTFTTDRELLHT